jgi:hypothetical protein
MDRLQLDAMRLALRSGLDKLEAVNVSCASCSAFNSGRCKVYDAVPPADVQRSGCEAWAWDGVPW